MSAGRTATTRELLVTHDPSQKDTNMIDAQTWLILGTIVLAAIAIALYARRLIHATVRDVWQAIEATAKASAVPAIAAPLRKVQPISSINKITPRQTTTIKTVLRQAFRPERVFVSDLGGTEKVSGAAKWIINDIRVDGQTQFSQNGDVPGDMFASHAIDGFVSFDTGEKEIEMDVTYVGEQPAGLQFYASIVGSLIVAPSSEAPGTLIQPDITIVNSGGRPTLLAGPTMSPSA